MIGMYRLQLFFSELIGSVWFQIWLQSNQLQVQLS